MKKLIIAAAVAMAAIASNAAAVAWNCDKLYKPGEKGAYTANQTDKGSVNGYLWELTGDGAKAAWEAFAADPSTIYAEFLKADHGTLGETTASGNNNNMGRSIALQGTTDWAVGADAYGIVLYTYNDGTKDWYVANAAKVADMGTGDASVASLNNYIGGSISMVPQGDAITGWTAAGGAVPEPTSGLLLLLGVAGLALRRRRA